MHVIPKLVHVCWKHKDLLESDHPLIVDGIRQLEKLNPTWQITVNDDQDIEDYLRKSLGPSDYQLIASAHIVEKSDLWRLFKIHNEGGLYVDIDRFCNVVLDQVIPDDIRCVLPTCLDHDFSQDIMLSVPKNPIYYKAIMLALQRRRAGQSGIYWLGPQTYMHAVTQTLLGHMINSNPGSDLFDQMRAHLAQLDGYMTYREHPPYSTFIYRDDQHDRVLDKWVNLKKDFYQQQKIKHWSGEW